MATTLENAASKGTANTALGLSIGALALEFLRGGKCGGLGGLLGGGCNDGCCNDGCNNNHYGCCGNSCGCGHGHDNYYNHCNVDYNRGYGYGEEAQIRALWKRDYEDSIETTKAIFCLEKQICDNRFTDYVYDNCEKGKLQDQINDLKVQLAVTNAVQPYQNRIVQMEIRDAREDARQELRWCTRNFVAGKVYLSEDQICDCDRHNNQD